jgi:hypothetical protein
MCDRAILIMPDFLLFDEWQQSSLTYLQLAGRSTLPYDNRQISNPINSAIIYSAINECAFYAAIRAANNALSFIAGLIAAARMQN